jgi:diacylglycerol kinase family enzyme
LLDVCMIKRLSLPGRFNILLKVPEGKHITDKRVNYYQTPGISLEFSQIVPFHVDGELNFAKEFEVTLLPLSLNTIYNPDGNHFFRR